MTKDNKESLIAAELVAAFIAGIIALGGFFALIGLDEQTAINVGIGVVYLAFGVGYLTTRKKGAAK